MVYMLSLEDLPGRAHLAGFHLGTDEKLARSLCEERMQGRLRVRLPVVTIALLNDDFSIADVLHTDGRWQSDMDLDVVLPDPDEAAFREWVWAHQEHIVRWPPDRPRAYAAWLAERHAGSKP